MRSVTQKKSDKQIGAKSSGNRQVEPNERAKRILRFWLRYDSWEPEEAGCLLADINPLLASLDGLDWDDKLLGPGRFRPWPELKSALLITESEYFSRFSDESEKKKKSSADPSSLRDAKSRHYAIDDKMMKIAHGRLRYIWEIFRRATDFTLDADPRSSPQSYIQWADQKGFLITWLKWAVQNDLLKTREIETPTVNDIPERFKPSDMRREEGLRAAIDVLRQKHAIGKLRNRQDFETCMRKRNVIEYIRKNPAEFPHCAKIKPVRGKNESGIIKEEEPTLTKDFPRFSNIPEILAEYERLVSKE